MLVAKRKKETYVALLYQLLSIDDLSQNANHQTVRCNVLQAKESEIFFVIYFQVFAVPGLAPPQIGESAPAQPIAAFPVHK